MSHDWFCGPDRVTYTYTHAYMYIRIYIYILGMGIFPDSLGASAKKVNNAMHRFKKCASHTSWHLYRDASFLTYLHQ